MGPEIKQLFRDPQFEKILQDKEKVWGAFCQVCYNFLGNEKAKNYKELVELFFKILDALKIPFVDSHLNFFPDNCGEVSDEHGERFHQDLSKMEQRYQGKWSTSMLYDFCWTTIRDTSHLHYERLAKRKMKSDEI